jgi:K+-transporting ATPase KdpF subunit
VIELARSPFDAVSTIQIVQNVIGGLAALALIVYLFVALIRPEKF